MRTKLLLLCVAGLPLGACGQALHSVANVAENTRTATEQMVTASNASNASREVEIYPDAGSLRGPPPITFTKRYEMREGPDGFMVYDTQNHTIARIQSQTQQGLTLDQAEKATEALAWANDHQESIGQLK
jgi:hypothetical protein